MFNDNTERRNLAEFLAGKWGQALRHYHSMCCVCHCVSLLADVGISATVVVGLWMHVLWGRQWLYQATKTVETKKWYYISAHWLHGCISLHSRSYFTLLSFMLSGYTYLWKYNIMCDIVNLRLIFYEYILKYFSLLCVSVEVTTTAAPTTTGKLPIYTSAPWCIS